MGRARRQDAEAVLAGEPIALLPERGLADSRIALKQQCLSARGTSPQKPIEDQQFLAPADQLACHRTLFRRTNYAQLGFAYAPILDTDRLGHKRSRLAAVGHHGHALTAATDPNS